MTTFPSNGDIEKKCVLIGGTFSMFVQGLLGVVAVLSLYLKWRLEVPRRAFRIWIFDVSKQAVAGIFAHLLNLTIAELLSHEVEKGADECAWYFINYVLDTVLGVPFAWILVRSVEITARRFNWESLKVSGDYGDPPKTSIWVVQILCWGCIIVTVKGTLAFPLYLANDQLTRFGEELFSFIHSSPRFELILVMIITPGLLNILQFWILDQILKKNSKFENGSRGYSLVRSENVETARYAVMHESENESTSIIDT